MTEGAVRGGVRALFRNQIRASGRVNWRHPRRNNVSAGGACCCSSRSSSSNIHQRETRALHEALTLFDSLLSHRHRHQGGRQSQPKSPVLHLTSPPLAPSVPILHHQPQTVSWAGGSCSLLAAAACFDARASKSRKRVGNPPLIKTPHVLYQCTSCIICG